MTGNNCDKIIGSLRGLVNDQFFSMIKFCLNLPFGGKNLAEHMLRDLAAIHSRSSINSEAFKRAYSSPPQGLSPADSLRYVFDIHEREKVIVNDWVEVKEENGAVTISYERDRCVYNSHCQALVCDGLECMCVRRYFCEGIIKTLTGKDYQSTLNTPLLDQRMCQFTLRETAPIIDEAESVITRIEASAEDNAKLLEAVNYKTSLLERQKKLILDRETQIRAIASSAADAIIMIDGGGAASFWNPAAESMFGYTAEEAIGRNISLLIVPLENREAFAQELATFNSAGGSVSPMSFEAEGLRKNGSRLQIEASLSSLIIGDKPFILGVVRDVTSRKKAENALKQLVRDTAAVTGESFFQTVVKNLTRLLEVRYAFISRVADANANMLETVTMSSGDEILPNFQYGFEGTPCETVVREKRYVSYSSGVASLFPKDSWLVENNIDSYAAIPFIDSRGIMLGHLGVMDVRPFESSDLNISIMKTFADRISSEVERAEAERERAKLDEKMRQTQKLESLGVLAGGIAHDFNNIFTAVLGDCDLALAGLSPDNPAGDNIHEIKVAIKHAAGLSHQMLAYSGRGKFNILDVNLNMVIREMAHLLERPLSKFTRIVYRLDESLPLITGDATQIRQVLLNLVTNASEAIGDAPGRITISTGASECDKDYFKGMYLKEELPAGLYVYFEVSDTGSGMDKSTLASIFDPFFTTKFSGRGLGLSAVLGIIRGHKGSIRIDSAPGKGSIFRVLFPAASKPLSKADIHPSAEGLKKTGTVLIIEDEEIVSGVADKLLRSMGFETIAAPDGLAGLEVFKARLSEISLVLLDLTMPRMDGLECLRLLRRIKPDARVIITSGYDEQEVSSLFTGKGAAGFLQKPFDMEMIREAVNRAFGL